MAALRGSPPSLHFFALHYSSSSSTTHFHPRKPLPLSHSISKAFFEDFPGRGILLWSRCGSRRRGPTVRCSDSEQLGVALEKNDRPLFDLNLAVVLAGFAFEAYTSPPNDVGRREVDSAGCQTVYLSEQFLRQMYDGQLFIKLKKGLDFPAMDPWGTSDPYVVIQIEGQVTKSNIKWATKEPTWNEELTLYVKRSTEKLLQIAAWDANLVTPHKRMGNAGIDLVSLCDGNCHDLVVELEGLGGGGRILLEATYKSFEKIDEEKQWWRIPFVSDFFVQSNLGSALKSALGAETVNAYQFVQFAFGQLNSFDYSSLQKVPLSKGDITGSEMSRENSNTISDQEQLPEEATNPENLVKLEKTENPLEYNSDSTDTGSSENKETKTSSESNEHFWNNLASSINHTVTQKFGFSLPEIVRWDGFDLLNRVSLLSQRNAEEGYVQSGLATPEWKDDVLDDDGHSEESSPSSGIYSSLVDIKKASRDVLSQTETVLGALMVLTATFSKQKRERPSVVEKEEKNGASGVEEHDNINIMNEAGDLTVEVSELNKTKAEDMKELFSTAESAMEAWAMLATSLGQTTFIKSEFEKICFLDNDSTDTQVAIWRDSLRRRLVVAFRGTEQSKWKDLRTDLMLVPSGLNPERLGGDFKEVQVHSGFLSAYDSVRNRIMTLIKHSIGYVEDGSSENFQRWHVYITGHSLGGALATLLALELSSSRMTKSGMIYVTMYNFGSPRVGNKRFADVYNEKVKDSWRIVNHRDIIPTVPRLMGYCHVAQPVYLAAGDLKNALTNLELLEDGYQGDVIGEYTPDVLVNEFMKGEKELVEKILQTEINLFRSIRDGTALMQHMEDFYYITLLESVRSNYRTIRSSDTNDRNQPLTS